MMIKNTVYIETYDPDGEYNFETEQCRKCRQHFREDDILNGWCSTCLDEMMNNDTLYMMFIAVDSDSFATGNI